MSSTQSAAYDALAGLFAQVVPDALIVHAQVGTYKARKQLLLADLEGQDAPLTMGNPTSFTEEYGITCEAHYYAGGADIYAARMTALAMKDAVRGALNADRTVGFPEPMRAYMSAYAVTAGFDGDGVSAQVQFVVQFSNVTP